MTATEPTTSAATIDHAACLLSTSFALLHDAAACADRYRYLGKALGGIDAYGRTTPIPLTRILETNGLDDALWALRAVQPEQKEACERIARLFACDCAERAIQQHDPNPDPRSIAAIDVARRYARAEASAEEWDAAWDAARDAARAAARDAAWDAVWAAARDAARAAAWDAAWDAEQQWQAQVFTEYLTGVRP